MKLKSIISYLFLFQIDSELLLAPGFASPSNHDYKGYHSYISENLPPESPYLYGLHPNAEIGFLTTTSENLFRTVLEMQPRDSSGTGGSGTTREEHVRKLQHCGCHFSPGYFQYVSAKLSIPDILFVRIMTLGY